MYLQLHSCHPYLVLRNKNRIWFAQGHRCAALKMKKDLFMWFSVQDVGQHQQLIVPTHCRFIATRGAEYRNTLTLIFSVCVLFRICSTQSLLGAVLTYRIGHSPGNTEHTCPSFSGRNICRRARKVLQLPLPCSIPFSIFLVWASPAFAVLCSPLWLPVSPAALSDRRWFLAYWTLVHSGVLFCAPDSLTPSAQQSGFNGFPLSQAVLQPWQHAQCF